jgi:DNA-directed RNA polymerase specialized sigma24 family protein
MSRQPSRRALLRVVRRGLRRMTPFQREVFLALRIETVTYADLARLHGVGVREIEAAFTQALVILMREGEPWWRRLWPW